LSEKKIISGLTLKSFIIATIGELIFLFFGVLNGYNHGLYFDGVTISPVNTWRYTTMHHWEITPCLISYGIIAFLALIVASLNSITKRSVLSRQEMAVIITAWTISVFPWDIYSRPYHGVLPLEGAILTQAEEILPALKASIPPLFKPGLSEDFWKRFLLSPYYAPDRIREVPWGAVAPMTVWLVAEVSFWTFIFLFSLFLARYIWLTVEYLISPPADYIMSMIDYSQPIIAREREKASIAFFKNKYFIIPFMVFFIYAFMCYGYHMWHGLIIWYTTGDALAAQYAINLNMGGIAIGALRVQLWPNWDFTRLAILPWVPLLVNLAPHYIAWALLVPTKVIANVIVATFAIWWIWPLIFVSSGVWPNMPPGSTQLTVHWNRTLGYFPTLDAIYLLQWGLWTGLALSPLIVNWRRFAPIFKSLYQKEPEDFDTEKPYPYRYIWIGLIVSAVVWLGLINIMAPIPIYSLIIWMICSILLVMGAARMVAETGGLWGYAFSRLGHGQNYAMGSFVARWTGIVPAPGEPEMWRVAATNLMFAGAHSSMSAFPYAYTPLATINLQAASLTNTSMKSMLKTLIYGLVLALSVGAIIFWWFATQRAFAVDPQGSNASMWDGVSGGIWRTTYESAKTGTHPWNIAPGVYTNPTNSYALLLGGLLFAIIIPILQARLPILANVSVASITLAAWEGDHLLFAFIVALIIKLIAMRVGGYTLYNEKIKPIALGTMAGVVLSAFIGAIAQVLVSPATGIMF